MAADAEQGLKANQRALATNQFALVLKAKALGTFKTQLAPGAILSNGRQWAPRGTSSTSTTSDGNSDGIAGYSIVAEKKAQASIVTPTSRPSINRLQSECNG